jgi:hypothetical protein
VLNYLLRRIIWSAATLFVMSMLVFAGVYAIGNPVELLISPQANAFSAEIRSPDNCICAARRAPIAVASKDTPPHPGKIPSFRCVSA